MRLKDGVKLDDLQPQMVLAAIVVEQTYQGFLGKAYEITLTSVDDSTHGAGSLHPHGKAIDVRTNDVPHMLRPEIADSVRKRLGAQFDVVLEKDHLHVEYDPK